jgi:hypothetical protein
MTEPTRLPGVKGSWILAAECPPTETDADSDGDVCVHDPSSDVGYEWFKTENVRPNEYWCPVHTCDHRPFTLPSATPTPPQPAAPLTSEQAASLSCGLEQARNMEFADPPAERRLFKQLIPSPDGNTLWAIADDGTAWLAAQDGYDEDANWRQIPSLPDREAH